MSQIQVHRHLEITEAYAFRYIEKENLHNKLQEKIKTIQTNVKESGLKALVVAASGLAVIIGLVALEINLGEMAFATVFDRDGQAGSTSILSKVGGGIFAVGALLAGYILHKSIRVETDPITERKSRKVNYFSLLGALIAITTIITFQYYLHLDTGGDKFIITRVSAIVLPLVEVLFGMLFFEKALNTIYVYVVRQFIRKVSRTMRKLAQKVKESFRDYELVIMKWNTDNPNSIMEMTFNPNIRRAIAYFDGYNLEEIDNQKTIDVPHEEVNEIESDIPDNPITPNEAYVEEDEITTDLENLVSEKEDEDIEDNLTI